MKPPAIRCFGLTKRYGGIDAVYDVELTLYHGELLVILGPSACGKTTLLRMIAGFEYPDRGTLAVEGRILAGPGILEAPEKRNIGMVAQDYALFPHMNVAENVSYGLDRKTDRVSRIKESLDLVGLTELEHRMPHELSGGEQQRVALARALAPKPDVILLDEPFSNLDMGLRSHLRAEVRWILKKAEATAIFVTHDQEDAMYLGDRIAVMHSGRLEQVDTPEEVYTKPLTRFVAEFMGHAQFLPVYLKDGALVTEVGKLSNTENGIQGDVIEVMVRPDDISIEADPEGGGVIIERVFLGTHYIYTVRLSSGEKIKVFSEHREKHPLFTKVVVKLNTHHYPMCLVDGEPRLRDIGVAYQRIAKKQNRA
jgi:iron(III) transport system ATP-binding protein